MTGKDFVLWVHTELQRQTGLYGDHSDPSGGAGKRKPL